MIPRRHRQTPPMPQRDPEDPYSVSQASRIYFLPNLMTAGNLGCGFWAIIHCIQARLAESSMTGEYGGATNAEHYKFAVWCIFGAAAFDALDGRLARMGGRESLFGAEFDSLADVISFGMAPALLMLYLIISPTQAPEYQWFRNIGWFIGFVYLLCAAMRLARFNVITNPLLHRSETESHKDFVGLPIPAAAGTVASLVLLLLNMAANAKELRQLTLGLPLLLILVSFLMVSTVRYPSFKQVNWETKTRFRTFVIVFIGILLVVRLQEVSLFFLFLAYIAYGLFTHYQRGVRHAQMRALRRKVVKMKQEGSE